MDWECLLFTFKRVITKVMCGNMVWRSCTSTMVEGPCKLCMKYVFPLDHHIDSMILLISLACLIGEYLLWSSAISWLSSVTVFHIPWRQMFWFICYNFLCAYPWIINILSYLSWSSVSYYHSEFGNKAQEHVGTVGDHFMSCFWLKYVNILAELLQIIYFSPLLY
jgi:hypothetical protein